MKTRNKKLSVLLCALLIGGSAFIYAQPAGPRNGQRGQGQLNNAPGHGPKAANQWMQQLNLDDTQKEKIKELRLSHRQSMTVLKAELNVLNAELKLLTVSENPKEADINSKIDDITAVKGKVMKAQIGHRLAIRELLNEEQQAIFDAHAGKRKHRQHMVGNRGHCGGPGSGRCPMN